mmetsp:Transcript_31407/g.52759  ORF Transcript_31407/g.52759 Transcript_31407/m.52759 type:complete len:557 (+) Transcript_31407:346-2016(+)|eukprot:CAMPEP_0198213596 /NCGR_PEP_ID=MMETSP1445-20131203/28958_1 /TAXON_ID=36898 /ORGANISM="Pyramimonas sp., Strain CCMP2087" /LENGTH=556 /DNA_ID=CAMNT_0043888263 /DNA_START=313 /DNA_END=1983 /DNA_ORIENTATION=+
MGSENPEVLEALTLHNVQKPPFALTLRLTPELQQDLLRAASLKADVSIKFGSNTSLNVISVDGKEFTFTSFKEKFCDVYARRNQEEMWEVGTVSRKCNVMRKLDTDEKSRIKSRRLEAETLAKSRKSEALDRDQSVKLSTNPERVSKPVKTVLKGKPAQPPKKPTRITIDSGASYSQRPTHSAPHPVPKLGCGNPRQQPLGSTRGVNQQEVSYNSATISQPHSEPEMITARPNAAPAPAKVSLPEKKQLPPLTSLSAATQAAAYALAKGKSGLRAAAIVLLNERALTSKVLEKTLMEVTKERFSGVKNQGIEKLLKQIAIFKAPGRYFLTPETEEEYNTIIAELQAKGSVSGPVTPQPEEEKAAGHASPDSVSAAPPHPRGAAPSAVLGSRSSQPAATFSRIDEFQASGSQPGSSDSRGGGGGHKRRRAEVEAEDPSGSDDEFFAPYETQSKPTQIAPIASIEQYEGYCELYNQKYPVYLRMHAELGQNGKDFLSLEAAYKRGDRHEKAVAEVEMRTLLRQRSKRHARMDRVFAIMHEELQQVKQMVVAFQETNHQ